MITENQLKRAFNLFYELGDYEALISQDCIEYLKVFNSGFHCINGFIFQENGDVIVDYTAIEYDTFGEERVYHKYSVKIPKEYLICENKLAYLNIIKK